MSNKPGLLKSNFLWKSSPTYTSLTFELQAEECLKREKERVGHYLHASSEPKLLEVSRHFHDHKAKSLT